MNAFTSMLILAVCGLAAAGHHGGAGGAGGKTSYTVVTKHEAGKNGGGGGGGYGHKSETHYEIGDALSSGGWEHDSESYGHAGGDKHEEHYADHHPKYQFDYGVQDSKTGDVKNQWEERDGGNLKGGYSLKESDGTTRVVEYEADDHKGFNAKVFKIGEAHAAAEEHHGGYEASYADDHYGHGHGHASSHTNVKLH